MRIILFEGVDKVGKTTSIKKLDSYLTSLGYNVVKLNIPFEVKHITGDIITSRLRMSINNIIEMDKLFDDNYICLLDRFHISENVFSKFFKRKTDRTLCNFIDYKFRYMNSLLIYIQPDDCKINFNKFKVNNRIDGFTFKQYLKLFNRFNKEYQQSEITKIKIKTSNLDNLPDKINEWL